MNFAVSLWLSTPAREAVSSARCAGVRLALQAIGRKLRENPQDAGSDWPWFCAWRYKYKVTDWLEQKKREIRNGAWLELDSLYELAFTGWHQICSQVDRPNYSHGGSIRLVIYFQPHYQGFFLLRDKAEKIPGNGVCWNGLYLTKGVYLSFHTKKPQKFNSAPHIRLHGLLRMMDVPKCCQKVHLLKT